MIICALVKYELMHISAPNSGQLTWFFIDIMQI